ncbi:MAG: GAF domain-containing protein [Opitutales bacterium]|nr:GAF domain-containing protein [Opitutales bacterium]NRA28147.1 GAF domain-containing protein [Opitutales bacterium]
MKTEGIETTVIEDAASRLADLMHSGREERYERLTRMARALFDSPVAVISFLDPSVQWFKSNAGLQFDEHPRAESFCQEVLAARKPLIIEDTRRDTRFATLPLVTGNEGIKFYAGAPIFTPEGDCIGTFAVMSREPHEFSETDLSALLDLVRQVEEALWETEYGSVFEKESKREYADIETFFALKQILPLDILSDEELMLVVRFGKTRTYPPKSLIAAGDTPTTRLYILLDGSLENAEGMQLHPIVGAVSLALDQPPAYTVFAGPDGARCLTLLRAQYLALINRCPKLMRSLIRMITFGNK